MQNNIETKQLQSKSIKELREYKNAAISRKAELEMLKVKGGKDWTEALQEEYNNVAIFIVDVDDVIDEKIKQVKFIPEKGEEKHVHLIIVHGCRFNSSTGEEISKPVMQKFSYSEFNLFKQHCKSLGYTVKKVLHDPYGEASTLLEEASAK